MSEKHFSVTHFSDRCFIYLLYFCRYNVVPVVYGGANYTQFAPPNSYVNVLDFESPKELAIYLKYLSQDLQVYESFFRWKKYYRVTQGTKEAVCTLCKVLHKRNTTSRYTPLSDWYAKDKCRIQTLLDESGNRYATKKFKNLKSKRV